MKFWPTLWSPACSTDSKKWPPPEPFPLRDKVARSVPGRRVPPQECLLTRRTAQLPGVLAGCVRPVSALGDVPPRLPNNGVARRA